MRLGYVILLLIVLLIIVSGCTGGEGETGAIVPENPVYEGTVTKITEGDALEIDGVKIRLALVDSPNRNDWGFVNAIQFTKSLCPVGSSAEVDVDDIQPTDSSGRRVAVVYCGKKNLNFELYKTGHATIDGDSIANSEFDPKFWN